MEKNANSIVNIFQLQINPYLESEFDQKIIPSLCCKQGDNNGQIILIKFMNGNSYYELNNNIHEVKLKAQKPDSKIIFIDLKIQDGYAILPLTSQLTSCSGTVQATALIIAKNLVQHSIFFEIKVKKNILQDDEIFSENDLSAIHNYVDRAENAAKKSEEYYNYIKDNPSSPSANKKILFDKNFQVEEKEHETLVSLNVSRSVEKDNTLPITSAAVYTEIGNINALLEII